MRGVCRAWGPYDFGEFDNPLHALLRFNVESVAHPDVNFWIEDADEPEDGDITDRIAESYCDEVGDSGLKCYTPLDADGLCAFRGFHRENEA